MKSIFSILYGKLMKGLLVLILAACSNMASSIGWKTYNGASFSLEHPDNWTVDVAENGLIRVKGTAEEALLWPFFVNRKLQLPEVKALLFQLGNKVLPGYSWKEYSAIHANNTLRINGETPQGKTAVAVLQWYPAPQGVFFQFYACDAPSAAFAGQEENFARILQSFRPHPMEKGKEPSKPAVQYKKYTDPFEQAFTIEVPADWKVEGGLFRASAIDIRSHVRISSPDGAVHVFFGDKELPYFAVPNATLEWTGFREGSWYSPGYGSTMMVRRYIPGLAFAQMYAQQITGRGLQFFLQKERPDIAQQLVGVNQKYGNTGFYQRLDMGEVGFRFDNGGGAQQGYIMAGTGYLEAYGIAQWHVEYLYGYLSPPNRASEAEEVIAHLIQTTTLNPQWVQMQQGVTSNVSKIVTETSHYVANVIRQSFEATQASQDRTARQFSDYIRGVERVVDQTTGTMYEVQSGNNYYWIDNLQQVLGTDIYTNPDPLRFRELIRVE